jgi:cytochrome c-type biogenesis protein CcmF
VFGNDLGYWGGQVSHIGLAFVAIALATTSGLAVRETVAISQGESAVVDGYCIEYLEPFSRTEPNRAVQGVRVAVLDSSCSTVKAELEPRINTYEGSAQPIGTPAVWTGFVDDVYVGIAGGTTETIELNVFVFPLQWLLWVGGLIVVLGGVVALGRKPGRRRRTSDDVTARETGTGNV